MQRPMIPDVVTVREHRTIPIPESLTKDDIVDLQAAAATVLKRKSGRLAASNYVGIVTTRRGTVIEILPKIDLGDETADNERTRGLFLKMLRCWRRLNKTKALPESSIRSMQRFPMLEIFFHQFLVNLNVLVRGGACETLHRGRRELAVYEGENTFSRATP